MFYDNGEIYEGQWKNDKRNGNGTLFNANGKVIYRGEWSKNETSNELSEINNEVPPKKIFRCS